MVAFNPDFKCELLANSKPDQRVFLCELCGDDCGAGPFRHDGRELCRHCKLELLREPDYSEYEDFDGRGVIAFIGICVLSGIGLVLMALAIWG